MARPSKADSWLPTDSLRIRVWYRALLQTSLSTLPKSKHRSVDFQRFLEMEHIDVASSRLTDWKLGRCMPSKGRLQAFRAINDDLAQCELLLNNSPVLTDNPLSNLLITLDTFAAKGNMRQQCMSLLSSLASPWTPRVLFVDGVASGWQVPKLWNRVVDASVARRVNALDPLSTLDYCLYIADAYIAPRLAVQKPPERWSSVAHAWGFDVLCMCLLINRLVNRELTYTEGELVSKSADFATILRRVLLAQIQVSDTNRVMRMFKGLGMPCSSEFVEMVNNCAVSIRTVLADHGIVPADIHGYLKWPTDTSR